MIEGRKAKGMNFAFVDIDGLSMMRVAVALVRYKDFRGRDARHVLCLSQRRCRGHQGSAEN